MILSEALETECSYTATQSSLESNSFTRSYIFENRSLAIVSYLYLKENTSMKGATWIQYFLFFNMGCYFYS
jgi:hypothetical protein